MAGNIACFLHTESLLEQLRVALRNDYFFIPTFPQVRVFERWNWTKSALKYFTENKRGDLRNVIVFLISLLFHQGIPQRQDIFVINEILISICLDQYSRLIWVKGTYDAAVLPEG